LTCFSQIGAAEISTHGSTFQDLASTAGDDIRELQNYVMECPTVHGAAQRAPQAKGAWVTVLHGVRAGLETPLETLDPHSDIAEWAAGLASRASGYPASRRPLVRSGGLDMVLGVSELFETFNLFVDATSDLEDFDCSSSKVQDAQSSLHEAQLHEFNALADLNKANAPGG
jgi:hypothetical protein